MYKQRIKRLLKNKEKIKKSETKHTEDEVALEQLAKEVKDKIQHIEGKIKEIKKQINL